MIDWDGVSEEESLLIDKIAKRAQDGLNYSDPVSAAMDVTACHVSGCPLKLDELLKAKTFDFMHDIRGINANINRETGKLENCFRPRFAK